MVKFFHACIYVLYSQESLWIPSSVLSNRLFVLLCLCVYCLSLYLYLCVLCVFIVRLLYIVCVCFVCLLFGYYILCVCFVCLLFVLMFVFVCIVFFLLCVCVCEETHPSSSARMALTEWHTLLLI